MVRFTFATVFTFALAMISTTTPVAAIPSPQLSPDPAGDKNVGNAAGQQFIGGECLSSADCQSACCAVLPGTGGICSGVGAQFQSGKQGCGFGDDPTEGPGSNPLPPPGATATPSPSPSPSAAPAAGGGNAAGNAGQIDQSLPGAENVGTGNGQQFITGQCFSDADCASACCAKPDGTCSSPAVAFDSGKQGCGFVV